MIAANVLWNHLLSSRVKGIKGGDIAFFLALINFKKLFKRVFKKNLKKQRLPSLSPVHFRSVHEQTPGTWTFIKEEGRIFL